MVHASHYRYRRFTFIVRNFFFEIFSILLGSLSDYVFMSDTADKDKIETIVALHAETN